MMPGLGKRYNVEIETISKPLDDYHTDEYYASGLPIAPTILINGETVLTGDISEEELEALIYQHLGMEPSSRKKGFLGKIFGGR